MSIQGGRTWLRKMRSPICRMGDRPYMVVWSSKLHPRLPESLSLILKRVKSSEQSTIQALITASCTHPGLWRY